MDTAAAQQVGSVNLVTEYVGKNYHLIKRTAPQQCYPNATEHKGVQTHSKGLQQWLREHPAAPRGGVIVPLVGLSNVSNNVIMQSPALLARHGSRGPPCCSRPENNIKPMGDSIINFRFEVCGLTATPTYLPSTCRCLVSQHISDHNTRALYILFTNL